MINIFSIIVSVAVLLVVASIAVVVQDYYKTKVDEANRRRIKAYAEIVVRAVEDKYTGKKGSEKREAVIGRVVTEADKMGVKISVNDIEDVVRAVYNTIKANL